MVAPRTTVPADKPLKTRDTGPWNVVPLVLVASVFAPRLIWPPVPDSEPTDREAFVICDRSSVPELTITGPPAGSEAIRIGQALGYQLEDIYHLRPETIARAGEGDEAAMRACDEERFRQGKRTAGEQRPSMGQDMQKGRRTEIEFINGLIAREGERIGVAARANAVLTDIVKRVERGELKADPKNITDVRLN